MAELRIQWKDCDEFTWITEATLKFLQLKGICHEAFRDNIIASHIDSISESAYGITKDSTFTYITNTLYPGWIFAHVDKDKIYGKYILDKLNRSNLMHYWEWDVFRHEIYLQHKGKKDELNKHRVSTILS